MSEIGTYKELLGHLRSTPSHQTFLKALSERSRHELLQWAISNKPSGEPDEQRSFQTIISVLLTYREDDYLFLVAELREYLLHGLSVRCTALSQSPVDGVDVDALSDFITTLPANGAGPEALSSLIKWGVPGVAREDLTGALVAAVNAIADAAGPAACFGTTHAVVTRAVHGLLADWGLDTRPLLDDVMARVTARIAEVRAGQLFDLAKDWPDSAPAVRDITRCVAAGAGWGSVLAAIDRCLARDVAARLLLPSVPPALVMSMLASLHGVLTALGAPAIISRVGAMVKAHFTRTKVDPADLLPTIIENIGELQPNPLVSSGWGPRFDPQPVLPGLPARPASVSLAGLFISLFRSQRAFLQHLHARLCDDMTCPDAAARALRWAADVEHLTRVVSGDGLDGMEVVLHDVAASRRTVASLGVGDGLGADTTFAIISHNYWADEGGHDYMAHCRYPPHVTDAIGRVTGAYRSALAPRRLIETDLGRVVLTVNGVDVGCRPLQAVVLLAAAGGPVPSAELTARCFHDTLPACLRKDADEAVTSAVQHWVRAGLLEVTDAGVGPSAASGPALQHSDAPGGATADPAWPGLVDRVWAWLGPFIASRPSDLQGLTTKLIHRIMGAMNVQGWATRTEADTDKLLDEVVRRGVATRVNGIYRVVK